MGFSTASANVEVAGLAGEFCSFYADRVFTDSGFDVTVQIVLLGVCGKRAAELAVYVEFGGFRGVVEEPDVSFRRILRRREEAIDQQDGERRQQSHVNQLPGTTRIVTYYKHSCCDITITLTIVPALFEPPLHQGRYRS